MAEADPRLGIGGNNPPPLETWKLHIEELMEQANQFLDGEPIATQEQADSVGQLLGLLRQARKGADEQRATEKKPHDDAAKAVQANWKPLLDRCDLAEQTAKRALAPFLLAQEAKKQAEAAAAREAAAQAAREAEEARRAASESANLAAREEADRLAKQAEKAASAANKAEKAKPLAAGLGRAVGLRSVWTAELVDPVEALKFYRAKEPEALKDWLRDQAAKDVRAGLHTIPGFAVTEERVAQ
jgi:hypothetical protein